MALKFSEHCGENICIHTCESEWKSVYSGGICFSETPLGSDPLQIRIDGSSHVIIGYFEREPTESRPRLILSQFKRTTDVRVHKSLFTLSMKLSLDGRHLHIDGGNRSECFDVTTPNIWLTVYIQFGSASVFLESPDVKFSNHHGDNIELTDDNRKAALVDENPAALCYIETHLNPGDAIDLRINPVTDPVKVKTNSLPSRFYIRIGYYLGNLETHRFKKTTVRPETVFADWVPVRSLEKGKCLGNLQLGVSASCCFIFASESGENGSFPLSDNHKSGLVCVLELFRVRAKLLRKIRLPIYDSPLECSRTEQYPCPKNDLICSSLFEPASFTSTTCTVDEVTKAKQVENADDCISRLQFKSQNGIAMDQHINSSNTPSYTCGSNGSSPGEATITFSKRVLFEEDESEQVVASSDDLTNRLNVETGLCSVGSTDSNTTDNNNDHCSTCGNPFFPKDLKVDNVTKADAMNIPVSKCEVNGSAFNRFNSRKDTNEMESEMSTLRDKIKHLEEENRDLRFENEMLRGELTLAINKNKQKDTDRPTSPICSSISVRLYAAIQNNYVRFVNDLEIPDLCDHLFQDHQISRQDHEELHHLCKQNKREANRLLLTLVRNRAISYDTFHSALSNTKQEGLVYLLNTYKHTTHS